MGQAAELALALDPALIFEQAGMQADAWQADLLRRRSKRLILNCSRRSGKSTVVGAMALDYLRMKQGAVVLIFAPTERQSKESLTVVMKIYGKSGMREKLTPSKENSLEVGFSDGARIIALPGVEKNVRGLPDPDFVIIDEASRVPDELYYAVRPMLKVRKSALALLSTPHGKRGFFYKAWSEGTNWDRVKVTADQCPRITPESIQEDRDGGMPDSWIRQEYYGEFRDADGAMFSHDDIAAAIRHDIEPLFPEDLNTDTVDNNIPVLFQ